MPRAESVVDRIGEKQFDLKPLNGDDVLSLVSCWLYSFYNGFGVPAPNPYYPFQEEQLSVYVTARQYGSLASDQSFVGMLDRLWDVCRDVVDNYVIDSVLQPLARTISPMNCGATAR